MKKSLVIALLAIGSLAPVAAVADSGAVPDPRTQVYALADVDRPPKLIVERRPKYPTALNAEGVAGEVAIECVVDLDGNVRDPAVKSSTRTEFELPALQCVSKWKFRPGRKGKQDVNVRMELTVKFQPKK